MSGFWAAGWTDVGRVPTMSIERGAEGAALRYLADNILPYTERAWIIFDRLQEIGSMWVGEDRVTLPFVGDPPFHEVVLMAEDFLRRYDQLSAEDKSAFAIKFAQKPIVFSAVDDKLLVWGENSIHVGKNRLDDLFEYVLRTVSQLDAQILIQEGVVKETLGITTTKRPGLDHAKYLDAIRTISSTGEALSDTDRAIVRECAVFLTISDEFNLNIRISDRCQVISINLIAADSILEEIIRNTQLFQARPGA